MKAQIYFFRKIIRIILLRFVLHIRSKRDFLEDHTKICSHLLRKQGK